MEHKSYLEILAENDDEARKEFQSNAKDLLTANYVEYDDEINPHGRDHDELEDQHEFQKPQGSHQAAALLSEPPKDLHKTTSGVRYDKSVNIHVISIDSRFRVDKASNPSNFLFKLLSPIKNVISVRVSSLEIPNTWYTFSRLRGNISMIVEIHPNIAPGGISVATITSRVVITEGNYSVNTGEDNDILTELQTKLNSSFPTNKFKVTFNAITSKITISCFLSDNTTPAKFLINFADGIFSNRHDNWGLGYDLGFRRYQTNIDFSHTSESIIDVLDSHYVFLSLNPDWRVVEHNQPDTSKTTAFAKVIVDVPKNDVIYEDGANTITKQYFLKQPTNLTAFNVSLKDEYNQFVHLEGGNMSITLEVTEVLDSSLYETMRS
jgi:hypothetical protein